MHFSCYHTCKHYKNWGYCDKFDKSVKGNLHPFYYESCYYTQKDEDGPVRIDDLSDFVNFVEKYLDKNNKLAVDIIAYYRKHNKLSFKQRRVLAGTIFHCYEEKPPENMNKKKDLDVLCCQVED